jgi:hypothetical protein
MKGHLEFLQSFVIFHVFFKVGTCLVALLCTFSIFLISPTLNGDQTVLKYGIASQNQLSRQKQ